MHDGSTVLESIEMPLKCERQSRIHKTGTTVRPSGIASIVCGSLYALVAPYVIGTYH